jgi:hypothetical protein
MDAVLESSRIMFTNLNAVYALHAEHEECCTHCSTLKGSEVSYPCPTVYLLLKDMEAEKTPAE